MIFFSYFQDVLNSPSLGSECCEIQLHKDGSWSAHVSKKEEEVASQPAQESKAKIEVIPDDLGNSFYLKIIKFLHLCYFQFVTHFFCFQKLYL